MPPGGWNRGLDQLIPRALVSFSGQMSMAMGCWASRVSKFRINVRLSVQRKCHSVKPRCYQMTTLRQSPGFAALEGLRHPGIS